MTSRSTRLSARVQRRVVGRSIAAAIAGSAVAAVPASAFVLDAPEAGQNISVFHNLDFVAVFGYPADGTPVQVDVMRGAHRIGTVSAPAVVTPDGPGLEINHGPEGTPVPGDCFAGLTPDVRPGDEIVVRSGADAHEDRIRVDHLTIDGDPVLRSNGDIAVSGTAARADATRTPIPVTALDSAEFRDGKFRGVPTRVERTPGTTDGWTAIYEPPYLADRNDDNLDLDGRRLTLLGPIHTMGYGHVEVLPAETQLFEGAEASGPAPGCEAAPGQANVVNAAGAVTGTSGDLQVTGTAMAHTLGATDAAEDDASITGATVSITDGTTTITQPATGLAAGESAEQQWSATFPRADLLTLADGPLQASAGYTVAGSAEALGGAGTTISKDATSPNVVATPGPGDHVAPQSVALSAGPGETIRVRKDGVAASATSPLYTGPIPLGAGTTTITWWARDPAGNISSGSLEYSLTAAAGNPAPTGPAGAGTAGPAAAALVPAGPAAVLAVPARAVAGVRISGRLRLSAARRLGISVSFLAPRGARVAEVRLIERRGGVRRRLATRQLPVRGGERTVVRLRDGSVRRRLAAGRYEVEIRSGPSPAKLGPRTTRTVQLAP